MDPHSRAPKKNTSHGNEVLPDQKGPCTQLTVRLHGVDGEYAHRLPYNLSLNREGRWGTTDDSTTSFLHFFLFSTALCDLANSRPAHSLMLSSYLFFSLPCPLPHSTVPCKMVLARPDERKSSFVHSISVCVSPLRVK